MNYKDPTARIFYSVIISFFIAISSVILFSIIMHYRNNKMDYLFNVAFLQRFKSVEDFRKNEATMYNAQNELHKNFNPDWKRKAIKEWDSFDSKTKDSILESAVGYRDGMYPEGAAILLLCLIDKDNDLSKVALGFISTNVVYNFNYDKIVGVKVIAH